jgi:hypothetical protein
MKKLLLTLVVVAVAAAPAYAYVQVGHLTNQTPASATQMTPHIQPDGTFGAGDVGLAPLGPPTGHDGEDGEDDDRDAPPTRPVPEPGTLALASMGLLALGVAGRKRRGN